MATDPAVSEQTLIEGVWFAVEQAGRLLASATLLCDAGDCQSGLVMAMFGREELGRSRLLMEAASEVRAGAALSRATISERCKRHLDKHAAGALSTVLRPAPGDAAYDALRKRYDAKIGSPEWCEADAAVHAIVDAELEAAPKRRHAARMNSMYVDMTDDGAGWYRPVSVDALMARNEVSDAVNDYSVGLQRFRAEYVAAMRPTGPQPDFEALHKFKPVAVTLPAPVWPRLFSTVEDAVPVEVSHGLTGNSAAVVVDLKASIDAFNANAAKQTEQMLWLTKVIAALTGAMLLAVLVQIWFAYQALPMNR